MIPGYVYFGCGCGSSPVGKMAARDLASRETAHIVGDLNVETLSSVLAPGIRVIDRARFEGLVKPGMTVKFVNGPTESSTPGMIVTSAMAWVLPVDRPDLPGFIAELFGTPGIDREMAVERVEQDAMQLFAQSMKRMDFNARSVWRTPGDYYEIGGVTVKLEHFVASTMVNRDGDWTCAFVFAGMLPEGS